MTTVVALIGAKGLYLLYAWLIGAIGASWLSDRKGYGEKPGLATGLLTSLLGIVIWLLWPPKRDSKWKVQGPLPFMSRGSGRTVAAARAEQHGSDPPASADPPGSA
jgi:hypothetical protein